MSQADYASNIDPATNGGVDLNNVLDNWEQALLSNHSGPNRPSYVVANMTWIQVVSATIHRLNYYDGQDDIEIAVFNPTDNNISFPSINQYPVGSPIPYPLQTAPAGFLIMMGQSFNTATYPQLALAYPSGSLPDLRAEIIRGWDNARGVDTGRTLLSAQGDAIRNITGSVSAFYLAGSGVGQGALSSSTFSNTPARAGTAGADPGENRSISFNASSQVPTAAENRMRNVAFNYITRAA